MEAEHDFGKAGVHRTLLMVTAVWFFTTAMHVPDGFLSAAISILFWALSILALSYALMRTRKELGERQVPIMGVLAAVIFAGQMLNFTVTGGTSGHLLGAAIASILLGPWAAMLVLTCVVAVQALIFQDGGLLALGANIFNMGIVGVFVAYGIFRFMRRITPDTRWSMLLAGGLAGWTSIEAASLVCAIQLALSGTSPANIAIPAMGGIHALIGLGEGVITVGALGFLLAARPDLFNKDSAVKGDSKFVWIGGLAIATLLAILSPLASLHPDGLEWVAEQTGFLHTVQDPSFRIIPNYAFPGISNEALATIIAGIIGMLIVLGAALTVSRVRKAENHGQHE
jgi:cobalt/nickel transport system permease protein